MKKPWSLCTSVIAVNLQYDCMYFLGSEIFDLQPTLKVVTVLSFVLFLKGDRMESE